MLKNRVLPWINSLPGNQAVTLQQDGATAHTAKMVQACCKDNFKSFWSKELWPPSSPDLNPMDFGIWSILRRKACALSHLNVEKLKKKLKESWAKIKAKLFVPRVTKLSLASAVLSLKRADILNKLNSILKIIHLPLIFLKKKIYCSFRF